MEVKEEWKAVKGYEGLYEVSTFGRVKSLERTQRLTKHTKLIIEEHILSFGTAGQGYLRVALCKDGKAHYKVIHRLVAETFIPNPDGLPCVNHKDENKKNNKVTNLEWCDALYNYHYGTGAKRRALSRGKKVAQYSLDGDLIAIYPSTAEASRQLQTTNSHISCVCTGKRKTACGFVWRYVT